MNLNTKTTVRMARVAKAVERCSARDLSDFIDNIAWGYSNDVKYTIYQRVLRWADAHYTSDVEEAQ